MPALARAGGGSQLLQHTRSGRAEPVPVMAIGASAGRPGPDRAIAFGSMLDQVSSGMPAALAREPTLEGMISLCESETALKAKSRFRDLPAPPFCHCRR